MITDWIKENLIQVDVDAKDKEDAIRKAAQPLIDNNNIKESYVDEIITNLKESGPYFVLMPHVALPHAQSKDGVISNALGITILKKPIEFESEANDPVSYMFTLSSTKGEDHLSALAILAELLENEKFFNLLSTSKDPKEIYKFLQEYDKEDKNV